MRICKIFDWCASHQLNLPYESACRNMHGHNYKVEITVEGPPNEVGMVCDFKELKKIGQYSFDHKHLNDIIKSKNPTAENIVLFLKSLIDEIDVLPNEVKVYKIRVWETPTSYAEQTWK